MVSLLAWLPDVPLVYDLVLIGGGAVMILAVLAYEGMRRTP
jgi:hypothetical protein